MTNLPKVQEHTQLIQAVNARELHQFLRSRQDFSTWIKNRIADYDFVENQDFIRFHKKMEANNATLIEYAITLDMAKELSMVERNEQGKQARKYFIECERELRQQKTKLDLPQDYLSALKALVASEEQKQLLMLKNIQLQEKAEALAKISHAVGSQNVRDTAKAVGMKQNDFVAWCLNNDWLYRDDSSRLKAYQNRINQGFLEQKPVIYLGSDGTERVTMQPMFTPKGITHLANKFVRGVV